MSRYASSKGRLALLAVLLVVLAFTAGRGFGQATLPAGGASPAAAQDRASRNAFSLVLENLDLVFYTIGLLSVTGVALIIHGFLANRDRVFLPPDVTTRIRGMIDSKQWPELVDFTATDNSFLSRALYPALRRSPDFQEMREALETSVSELTANQFRKIEYLNIIGNLGPLLGLLGTVLGMIEAFQAMNEAGGQASPAQLAGGISKALAHTMLGLVLAVPCLAAFGVLRTIVDRLTIRGALLAEEMLLLIKSSNGEESAGTDAPAQVMPPPAIRTPV